jgi:hypothetical protein
MRTVKKGSSFRSSRAMTSGESAVSGEWDAGVSGDGDGGSSGDGAGGDDTAGVGDANPRDHTASSFDDLRVTPTPEAAPRQMPAPTPIARVPPRVPAVERAVSPRQRPAAATAVGVRPPPARAVASRQPQKVYQEHRGSVYLPKLPIQQPDESQPRGRRFSLRVPQNEKKSVTLYVSESRAGHCIVRFGCACRTACVRGGCLCMCVLTSTPRSQQRVALCCAALRCAALRCASNRDKDQEEAQGIPVVLRPRRASVAVSVSEEAMDTNPGDAAVAAASPRSEDEDSNPSQAVPVPLPSPTPTPTPARARAAPLPSPSPSPAPASLSVATDKPVVSASSLFSPMHTPTMEESQRAAAAIVAGVEAFNGKLLPEELSKLTAVGRTAATAAAQAAAEAGAVAGAKAGAAAAVRVVHECAREPSLRQLSPTDRHAALIRRAEEAGANAGAEAGAKAGAEVGAEAGARAGFEAAGKLGELEGAGAGMKSGAMAGAKAGSWAGRRLAASAAAAAAAAVADAAGSPVKAAAAGHAGSSDDADVEDASSEPTPLSAI